MWLAIGIIVLAGLDYGVIHIREEFGTQKACHQFVSDTVAGIGATHSRTVTSKVAYVRKGA